MGTTPNLSLPFPEDYEPLADVALAIENLALALDQKLQAGIVATGAFSAINTPKSVAVVFEHPYDVAPIVTVTADNGNPHQSHVAATAVTTSGFNVTAARSTGTAGFNVRWQAQPKTQ